MRARPDRLGVAVTLVVLLAANLVNHLVLPGRPWPGAIGLTVALAGIAAWAAMTAREVGLARTDVRRGLRWGGLAAAVIVAGYGVAWLVPAVVSALAPSTSGTASVLVTVFLVIPLTTVLPEELAFRGVLLGLLDRTVPPGTATLISSGAFGLWHVLAARGGGGATTVASDSLGGVVGPGAAGGLLVPGTVVVTALAGLVFCWLRRRSGSLVAPMLAHWALNACGVVFVALA